MQQRFVPSSGVEQNFSFAFPASIAVPDDVNYTIESDTFRLNVAGAPTTCRIRNKLNTSTLQVVDADGNIIVDNVGYYESGVGKIYLVGFKADQSTSIKLSCTPANPSAIVPQREYLLDYDNTRLSAKGIRTTASN